MKKALRNEIMIKRSQMSYEEVRYKSKLIKQRLFSFFLFKESFMVSFYCPTKNEVDTTEMIKEAIASGKKVVVPGIETKKGRMSLCQLDSFDELEKGTYNILEVPKEKRKEISLESIGIVIMPAIVVDIFGNRIGFGKGYYDKLLSKYENIKIALVYDYQIKRVIHPDKWDMPVDVIISEKRLIRVNV